MLKFNFSTNLYCSLRIYRDTPDIMALFNLFGKNKKPTPEKDTPVVEHPAETLPDMGQRPDVASSSTPAIEPELAATAPKIAPEPKLQPKQGFFSRIKSGLSRT
ncbi:MAG: hypothetical protein ACI84B_001472, partial [Oceanospirillaceae bacterium]